MQLLDGRLASQAIRENLKNKTSELYSLQKKLPHLAAILVGSNAASETYVATKVKNCKEVGITSIRLRFGESNSE